MAHPRGAHTRVAWAKSPLEFRDGDWKVMKYSTLDFSADGQIQKVVVIQCVGFLPI